jgi:uncharacterized membrane protein|tara:strand:+ start:165 stop:551 length:387 start_codon:yes stop_codon:yes gene_type:complete
MDKTNLDLYAAIILISVALIFLLMPPFNKIFLRIILSLPILFFIPGYVLLTAIFPGKDGIDGVERILFSLVLSIAVISIAGWGLSFLYKGINLNYIASFLYVFILLLCMVSIIRRGRLPKKNRFTIDW